MWDADGMLQPLQLCAKWAPALHPGWCMDGGAPPQNRSAESCKADSKVQVASGYGPASELSTGLARVAAVKPTQ